MNVIDIVPVGSQVQAELTGSDPRQQKKIRAQLRKDLSLTMSDSVGLVERLASGGASPTSWSESGELLAARDPELVTRLQQTATRDRFEAMRELRSQIDGLGINEAKSLLEALPARPPSAAG